MKKIFNFNFLKKSNPFSNNVYKDYKTTDSDLDSYAELFKNIHKKSSLWIAIKICLKHIKYFKQSLVIALITAALSTLFSILAILGINYLTQSLESLLTKNNDVVNLFGIIKTSMNDVYKIMILGIVILLFYFLNAAFNFLMNFVLAKVANKIGYYLRMDLYNKLQLLKLQYFDTHESGDIMSILTNDVFNIVVFVSQNFGLLAYGFASMFGMSILMFLISPYLTLIVYALVGILTCYVSYMASKSVKAFTKQQEKLGKINGYIEEIISAHNIVSLFQREKLTEDKFDSINNSLNKESEYAQTISGLFIPWMNFLSNFSVLIMVAVSVVFIDQNIKFQGVFIKDSNDLTLQISLINAFILGLRGFTQPINNIVGMIAQLQQALAGARRTSEVFIIKNEQNNKETINVGKLEGSISIKNLNFSYIKNKPILKNINLDVKPGETIAIVGPTGSGKTTIINLLTKFYDIDDGEIIFDNKYRIQEITKNSIRNQVSVVLQDTYLFSDTVKENIRYAKKDATDEEIIQVSKVSNCYNFIMQLEHGFDTQLSENASELSQGQKQLIAIARAMLSDSSILILDEATSNIDTRTEKVVQEAMAKLVEQKTAFVIAHRLSTIRNADKIVVLKDGEIIELGNHDQLTKQKGFYYRLSQSKSGVVDEEQMN